MMDMHSLGLLQVLVRQMQPGAGHQNAEVDYMCAQDARNKCILYTQHNNYYTTLIRHH